MNSKSTNDPSTSKPTKNGLFDDDDEDFLPKPKPNSVFAPIPKPKPKPPTNSSKEKKDLVVPGNSKRSSPLQTGNPIAAKKPKVVRKPKQSAISSTIDDSLLGSELFEEDLLDGAHVNELMSKVGSNLQSAVKAKKQKYNQLFKIGDSLADKIKGFQKQQMEERQLLFDQFKGSLDEITIKLKGQVLLEEKQTKMGSCMAKSAAELKQKVQETLKQHNSWAEKLETGSSDSSSDETTKHIKETAKAVQILYKNLLTELQKEGTEVFNRFFSETSTPSVINYKDLFSQIFYKCLSLE